MAKMDDERRAGKLNIVVKMEHLSISLNKGDSIYIGSLLLAASH